MLTIAKPKMDGVDVATSPISCSSDKTIDSNPECEKRAMIPWDALFVPEASCASKEHVAFYFEGRLDEKARC
jgi:hypothetical protein